MVVFNDDLMIDAATTRFIAPRRLDVAEGIVMWLGLHRIGDGYTDGYRNDPLALDEDLPIPAMAAVSARAG